MDNYASNRKKYLYIFSEIIGILLILYYLLLKLMFGFVAFSSVFFMLGVILLIYGFVELKFKIDIWGHIPKVLKIIITTLFAIGLVIFIGIESLIIYNGYHHDVERPDYVVVLGAGLRGNTISASLLYRLETALDFHEMYPDVKIVVSGGQGEGESMSEALAMRNFLVDNGVDPNLIIMENKSTNTYENFLYTKNVLEKETGKNDFRITIISNNFHMYRAKILAKEVGFNTYSYSAPSNKLSALVFYTREFFAVIKTYIFKQ